MYTVDLADAHVHNCSRALVAPFLVCNTCIISGYITPGAYMYEEKECTII